MRSEWRSFPLGDDLVSSASNRTSPTLKRRCMLAGRRRNADALSASSRSTTCRVTPTYVLNGVVDYHVGKVIEIVHGVRPRPLNWPPGPQNVHLLRLKSTLL